MDVTLYDTFASSNFNTEGFDLLLRDPQCGRVVVYSWNTQPDRVNAAVSQGAAGYLPKSLSADQLVEALERIHAGEIVTPDTITAAQPFYEGQAPEQRQARWPGQRFGLTARESEMVAFITQGWSNKEIAANTFPSPNTVKSYIRNAYSKMGVNTRPRAVIWGMNHDMGPNRSRTSVHHPQSSKK